VAFKDGRVTLRSFDDAHLNDPDLLALMERTDVKVSPELSPRYPEGVPNRVSVRTRDGAHLEEIVTFPRGHARNPMCDHEIETKFKILAEPHLSMCAIARVLDRCWNLETETDIAGLLGLFVAQQ
jgi:2-methylcitrate dehydratase